MSAPQQQQQQSFLPFSLLRQSSFKLKNVLLDYVSGKQSSKNGKFDVIIFGASGFAGRYTLLEAVEILKDYRWAVAGRNQRKLQQILKDVGSKTGTNLSDIPIIFANANDKQSLSRMAKKCKVIINCCGPYQQLGEPVVKACIEAGTHYVDLSAEPRFIDDITVRHNSGAAENQVYVVPGCGLHSLPIDVGLNYARHKFNGTIDEIEAYTEYWSTDLRLLTPIASLGVWQSIVHTFASLKDNRCLRQRLRDVKLTDISPISCIQYFLKDTMLGTTIPFPIIEQQYVERTQLYLQKQQKRPIRFSNNLSFPNCWFALIFLVWSLIIFVLSQFERSRQFLLNHPNLFTLGLFSNSGPDADRMELTYFRVTMHILGWPADKGYSDLDLTAGVKRKSMKISVRGVNPFYGVACVCALTSAIILMRESENLPEKGGVYTPGAAFANTGIISELSSHYHGVEFRVLATEG